MNEARELYVGTCSAVDKIDQLLRAWKFRMITWKWWHHPGMHGACVGFCMAYEIYKDCAEGRVDPEWKIPNPVGGPAFRSRLSKQMLEYDPRNLNYPGDAMLRSVNRYNKKRRGLVSTTTNNNAVCEDGQQRVGFSDYLNEIKPRRRGDVSRFGLHSSDILKKHLASMKQVGAAKCEVCNKTTFWRCELCDARMCLKSGNSASTLSCVLDFHSEDHLGLTQNDRTRFFGEKKCAFHGV